MSKIKKIVAVSDIHIKNYMQIDECDAVIEKFLHEMKELKPDRIVITGDVVHSKGVVSSEANDLVQKFLRGCSENSGKVIMIPGNHDLMENNKDRLDTLTPIVNALSLENLIYKKNTSVYIDEDIMWAIYSVIDGNEKPKVENPDNLKVFGVYHGIINGMYNDLGFQFKSDTKMDLFSDCDIVFAGDIHKRQVLNDENCKVIMVGSLMQQNFYETVSGHGYVIYDVDSDDYEFIDIKPLIERKRYQINDFNDIMDSAEVWVNS